MTQRSDGTAAWAAGAALAGRGAEEDAVEVARDRVGVRAEANDEVVGAGVELEILAAVPAPAVGELAVRGVACVRHAVVDFLEDAAATASATATTKAAAAVAEVFLGSGASLPEGKTAVVGQIFIRTGATAPGLYVCTASTSSASTWKLVSHAS